MTPDLRNLILQLLDGHRIMTVATNRPDGWPQATIVGYVNDGLLLYSFIARVGQKYDNITRDPRVSVAIASDFANPNDIRGLSLAGRAAVVENPKEFDRVCDLLIKRYPEYADWPTPTPALAPLLRITPEIISVLDYTKGFGHSDLVTIARSDLPARVETVKRGWFHRS